jgi:murein tripeptide amidase MpaA
LTATPRYEETVAWLRSLVEAAPELEMVSLGRSPEGRDIWMVIASKEQTFTPEALKDTGKPVVLAQAGIHSGEIDGKDAGLMLLRDMTVGGSRGDLLAGATLLFVPIFNVDGHERFSTYGRVNQRGPQETGWRTTARNLNLNRDYTKLDTPEMRAMIRALEVWDPDLYIDLHVTDGADYQYDITWGYNGPHSYSPNAAAWLDSYFTPTVTGDLKAMGHVPGPLVFAVDPLDMSRGNKSLTMGPRYSHGYGELRHIPSILVENHSLKPYDQRVLGTYVFLESTLRVVSSHGRELKRAKTADAKHRRRQVPLDWKQTEGDAGTMQFLGVGSRRYPSAVSGGVRVEWTGEPVTLEIPIIAYTEPTAVVDRPRAYWIPPAYSNIAERMELHGIEVERIKEARDILVTMYRLEDAKIAGTPYEGHVRASANPVPEKKMEHFPPGSIRIPTDQPLGDLAIVLLEPGAPDSFFQWGFFLEVMQRTEYIEGYVMEPLAARMLAETPGLSVRFMDELRENPELAADPRARLQWFYEKTPFFDQRWRLYPVAREE